MVAVTPPTTRTGRLELPDAELYYEVRGAGPALAIVGAPMGVTPFAPIADQLAEDHTVITTDPRGIGRSRISGEVQCAPPERRAADLAALLDHLGLTSARVFGSSGGAVTALAFLEAYPEAARVIVAHEPPLEELLDDAPERRRATQRIVDIYRTDGSAAAWARFMADAGLTPGDGPPGPDPTAADEPDLDALADELDLDALADERHFFLHQLYDTTHWQPDVAALGARRDRLVVGIGASSTGQICDLTSRALASAVGVEPTSFPGGHAGFVEEPEIFARRLREVLTGR